MIMCCALHNATHIFQRKNQRLFYTQTKEHRAQKSAFTAEDFPQKFKGFSAEKMKGFSVADRLFGCSYIA